MDSMRLQTTLVGLLTVSSVTLGAAAAPAANPPPASAGVRITSLEDRVKIEINGRPFSEYHFKGGSRPFLYPILGPNGLALTRNWPMKEVEAEERDHPHHRSFWYGHGEVNGHDFWSESDQAGKTVHEAFTEIQSGPDTGVIKSKNQLVAKDGTIVATDERTLRFYSRTDARVFDFEITIHASHGDLTFGDTKEGTMALRLAETMRLKPNKDNVGKPTGHIVNSEGQREGETWGKRAKWVDYYGPVEGKIVGVAIFDHPQNPRHPTWWHVRDYGLFAANPFGIHDFENQPAGTGDLKLKSGENLTFRYRFYLHAGDEKEARVAERYQEYTRAKAMK
jgi:hypothetical protein